MANWLVPFENLSAEQKRVITATPFEQNIFVEGPPGSGKTLVALHRARILAERSGLRPMIIMYNHSLYGFLRKSMEELGMGQNVIIETKDSLIWRLGREQGIRPSSGGDYETRYRELMAGIDLGSLPRLADVLILDEIQDFYQREWEILSRCGRYFIALGDFAQRIYNADIRREVFTGNGPKEFRHFRLNTIYRFGKSIARVAKGFGNARIEQLVSRTADQRPYAVDVSDRREAFEKIREIIEVNRQSRKRVAIAAPERYLLEVLLNDLGEQLVYYAPDNRDLREFDFTQDNRAVLITTYSLKGLEFDTVVVFGFDRSSNKVRRMREEDCLQQNIFVALTRSNENLYIIRDARTIPELRNLQIDVLDTSAGGADDDDYFDF